MHGRDRMWRTWLRCRKYIYYGDVGISGLCATRTLYHPGYPRGPEKRRARVAREGIGQFMSTIATICARGGSTGVPGKNIRPLLGKPLIVYTIEQALACPGIA